MRSSHYTGKPTDAGRIEIEGIKLRDREAEDILKRNHMNKPGLWEYAQTSETVNDNIRISNIILVKLRILGCPLNNAVTDCIIMQF